MVVYVNTSHCGAKSGVEVLLLVVLQVEGFQRVHGPIKQRVVQQHLHALNRHVMHVTDMTDET